MSRTVGKQNLIKTIAVSIIKPINGATFLEHHHLLDQLDYRYHLFKFPVLQKRGYSAQAAVKPSAGDYSVDVTSKHVKVVCAQVNNPLAKISFSFKFVLYLFVEKTSRRMILIFIVNISCRAGSRYERDDQLGLTHIMRKAVGLSTAEDYPFMIMRNANQYGLHLYATTDRETFTITAETHPAGM